MKYLNLKKSVDDWLTTQFIIFFLIGFAINVFSNGQATLFFIEDYYNIDSNYESNFNNYSFNNFTFINSNLNQKNIIIQNYTNNVYFKNKLALYISQVLYWIISPLVNLYFGLFILGKD